MRRCHSNARNAIGLNEIPILRIVASGCVCHLTNANIWSTTQCSRKSSYPANVRTYSVRVATTVWFICQLITIQIRISSCFLLDLIEEGFILLISGRIPRRRSALRHTTTTITIVTNSHNELNAGTTRSIQSSFNSVTRTSLGKDTDHCYATTLV